VVPRAWTAVVLGNGQGKVVALGIEGVAAVMLGGAFMRSRGWQFLCFDEDALIWGGVDRGPGEATVG
jgi:hypothetical protein